jgi:hypothetical protein
MVLIIFIYFVKLWNGKKQTKLTRYLQGKPMAAAHRLSFSFMKNDLHGTLQVMTKMSNSREGFHSMNVASFIDSGLLLLVCLLFWLTLIKICKFAFSY